MSEPKQIPSGADAASSVPEVSGGRGQRRPLQAVTGSRDFMGLPPHDQRASAAAIKAYFAQPKG
jgi:phage gpG-like protein